GDGVYEATSFRTHPAWKTRDDPDAPYRVLGEVGFIDAYRARLRTAIRERPLEIPRRAARRLLAATLVYRPYRPWLEGRHPFFVTLVHPLPAIGAVLVLVLRRRDRGKIERVTLAMVAAGLLPYVLVAF